LPIIAKLSWINATPFTTSRGVFGVTMRLHCKKEARKWVSITDS
jgi:hypothetical protein